MQNLYVISDLHIGLPQFRENLFEQFITNLPDGAELVLNGDTLDNPESRLNDAEQKTLNRLRREAERLRIIWVKGNHDTEFKLHDPGRIEFARFHVVPEYHMYISHGMHFDNVMPYNHWFIKLFRMLHRLRVRLGAPPVHVAEYAKKWKPFYRYLRNNVASNAIEHARENGWEHMVCGHVHYPEVRKEGEITYYNTGTWTELPPHYLFAERGRIKLLAYRGGAPAGV